MVVVTVVIACGRGCCDRRFLKRLRRCRRSCFILTSRADVGLGAAEGFGSAVALFSVGVFLVVLDLWWAFVVASGLLGSGEGPGAGVALGGEVVAVSVLVVGGVLFSTVVAGVVGGLAVGGFGVLGFVLLSAKKAFVDLPWCRV